MSTVAIPQEERASLPAWLSAPEADSKLQGPVQARQLAAWTHLEATGFPTARTEDWRYLSLAPLFDGDFAQASPQISSVSDELWTAVVELSGPRLVFVDGRYDAERSALDGVPAEVLLTSIAAASKSGDEIIQAHWGEHVDWQRHPFAALNLARSRDGVLLHVPRGVVLKDPIHLVFLTGGAASPVHSHPHVLIVMDEGSEATVVETHAGEAGAKYLNNPLSEIMLADGAGLEHIKLQLESEAACHLGVTSVRQGRDSRLVSHSLAMGGLVVRNDLDVRLLATGADVTMNGLYALHGDQHVDHHLRVDHEAPHGTSRQFYKGVLDDRSKGIFNGKVIVQEGAVKSDADQTNKNLILSHEAEADPKPELEIYNNDVKCSHGATVGQLDQTALFYLRSRGIDEAQARDILTMAFAEDVINRLPDETLRAACKAQLIAKLGSSARQKGKNS